MECRVRGARGRLRGGARSSDVGRLDAEVGGLRGRVLRKALEVEREKETCSSFYGKAGKGRGCSGGRWLMRSCDLARLALRPRVSYRRWPAVAERLPNCHALFLHLPNMREPYIFQLCIDRTEPHFAWVEDLGASGSHRGEIAFSAGCVASDYRLRLIRLPGHQDDRAIQTPWMSAAVSAVARTAKGRCI